MKVGTRAGVGAVESINPGPEQHSSMISSMISIMSSITSSITSSGKQMIQHLAL